MIIPITIYFLLSCFGALIVLSACAAASRKTPAKTSVYYSSVKEAISASSTPNGAGERSNALSRPSRVRSYLLPDPAHTFRTRLAISSALRRMN